MRDPALPEIGPALDAGFRWLVDIVQPDGAIVQHHGAYIRVSDEWAVSFVPGGSAQGIGRSIVILERPSSHWDGLAGTYVDPIPAGTAATFRGLLEARGHRVADQWNGDGLDSGSFALDTAPHPTLDAAVRRYLDGCPRHRSVFCGRQPPTGSGCSWFRDGHALLVQPELVAADGAL